MKAPVVISMAFDKASYVKGDKMTLTVVYTPGMSDATQSATYTATDNATGLSGTLTISFAVADGQSNTTVGTVTDTGNRTWAKVFDDYHTAVFTATA